MTRHRKGAQPEVPEPETDWAVTITIEGDSTPTGVIYRNVPVVIGPFTVRATGPRNASTKVHFHPDMPALHGEFITTTAARIEN